jgi:hypothetical protein
MSEIDQEYDIETQNSIVLGAAEKAAESSNVKLEQGVLGLILDKALKRLEELNKSGRLDNERQTIAANTELLLRMLIEEFKVPEGGTITVTQTVAYLSKFCEFFDDDFIPFCP